MRGVVQQAQHRDTDQEPVRRRALTHAENRLQRPLLRFGQRGHPVQQRTAELVEAGEGQFHLGLHAHGPQDREAGRRVDQVLQQRRLADAGLATDDEDAAAAGTSVADQLVEGRTFGFPPQQPGWRHVVTPLGPRSAQCPPAA